ncbi:MAG: undecaprenyl-diphosphatase UppP [Candidatus Buchananbacteria bacterium]|nr:undecaprenyl-diphosphatase UppP [Candidatus Buchananbacteria bacterium]
MNYLYSIIAGVVQGLTEFLPVSSSGHLILLHDWLGFNFVDNLGFDAILHWGTLFALLLYFRKEVVVYLKVFFSSFAHWNWQNDINQRVAWYILIATIPGAIFGYLFENDIETIFRSPMLIAITLILAGLLLFVADKYFEKIKQLNEIKLGSAIIIGLAQALALIPGVSRSAITIIAGLSQKMKREAAAKFSFLLSMPIIFGAGLKKLIDLTDQQSLTSAEWWVLFFGFISSFITGYFVIKYFLKFLQSHSFNVFVVYRLVLGFVILALILIK